MIPKDLIEDIRHQTDIVDIVSEAIYLKRSGTNLVGLCPFHEEKTPSFSVNASKQLYYCFGCGEGGTVIQFLMKYYGYTFVETIENLASRLNIDLAALTTRDVDQYHEKKEEKESLGKVLEFAASCFHASLMRSKHAEAARTYLTDRKYDRDLWTDWKLGYAPKGGAQLYEVLKKEGFSNAHIEKAGLGKKQGERWQDYFRDRLIFPITDTKGQTVAFGARALHPDQQPKYLNSSENVLFQKSQVLFALSRAQKFIRETGQLILVEGYTDVLSMHQYGISNTVACLGTAFTHHHARLLKKYTSKVTLLFDGDEAGRKAAKRALPHLLREGLSVFGCFLPRGLDPDSFLKQEGLEAIRTLLANSDPLLAYFVNKEFLKESELAKKTEFIQFLADIIGQTKDVFVREALIAQISALTGIEKKSFLDKRSLTHTVNAAPHLAQTPKLNPSPPVKVTEEEVVLLRVLSENRQVRGQMNYPNLFELVSDEAQALLKKLGESALYEVEDAGNILMDSVDDNVFKSRMVKVFMDESLNIKDDGERIAKDCLDQLSRKKIKVLSLDLNVAEEAGDQKKVQEIFKRISVLKQQSTEGFGVRNER